MSGLSFSGFYGSCVSWLLQLPALRYHRTGKGFHDHPEEYQIFVKKVLQPTLANCYGEKLGIVCASEHTRLLLKVIPELGQNIVCIADNNEKLWHKTFMDLPVLPPLEATQECGTLFISSTVHQRIIYKQYRELEFSGKVLMPHDRVPPYYFPQVITHHLNT